MKKPVTENGVRSFTCKRCGERSSVNIYRWRKKQLVRYRYTEGGDVRYFFKSIVIATKCNRLRVSGMRNDEVLGRLNRFKDNLIMSSCLNPKNRQL